MNKLAKKILESIAQPRAGAAQALRTSDSAREKNPGHEQTKENKTNAKPIAAKASNEANANRKRLEVRHRSREGNTKT